MKLYGGTAMMRRTAQFSLFLILGTSFVGIAAHTARAAGGLKTIENPKGGRIVYGQVDGQSTELDAMTTILRSLHSQYGERPKVGQLFSARGTQSVAVFFTLTRRTQDNGKVAGLIIVTKATTDHVEAALVTDDVARFASTLGPMMKTLFGVWQPLEAGRASGSGTSAPAAPLRYAVLRDRSASVGVPEGWNLVPSSANGTAEVVGPHGEVAGFNETILAFDPNDPWVRQQRQVAGRLYYPYGADLGRAFPVFYQTFRRIWGMAPADLQVSHAELVATPPNQRCIHINGHLDGHDGKGMQEVNAVLCTRAPSGAGSYMVVLHHTLIPTAFADRERATMGAILASFQPNMEVIRAEAAAYAAPVIAAIHAIGQQASANLRAIQERNDIQNSSFYKRWDDLDKRNAGFSNYQLDYSVVRDAENPTDHATLWNGDANYLMQRFPGRIEPVPNADLIRGRDF